MYRGMNEVPLFSFSLMNTGRTQNSTIWFMLVIMMTCCPDYYRWLVY
jgi:hypothetical protein